MFKYGFDRPISEPSFFSRDMDLPEDAILFFTEYVKKEVEDRLLGGKDIVPRVKPYVGRYKGLEIALIYPCFGAPATVMAIEIAIAAGVKRIYMLGEAGAIHSSLHIGDYFIPTWGYREEGTSFHYIPEGNRIVYESSLSRGFMDFLTGKGVEYHVGGIWCIDAIFRETIDKISYYSSLGVKCVDMESTAVMAVSIYRGVESTIFLTISDELYGGSWKTGWGSKSLINREVESLNLVLEYISSRYK